MTIHCLTANICDRSNHNASVCYLEQKDERRFLSQSVTWIPAVVSRNSECSWAVPCEWSDGIDFKGSGHMVALWRPEFKHRCSILGDNFCLPSVMQE